MCNCCRSASKTDIEEKTFDAVMSSFMTRVCKDRHIFEWASMTTRITHEYGISGKHSRDGY
jgi:hypothetical protein